ncbi:MAG: metal ABC transporter permease [Ardenticatenales bacterium]|nr:metal ABC transporter permease [Ardenticatenales bacterium]
MDLTLIFTDYTLRTVALGAMVLGIVSGTLGSFAVLRRQALLGDAMSHAALPGVVLAFMIVGSKALLPLMFGALISGWLGALLVSNVVRHTRIKEDAALGIVLSVFFGFGLLLLTYVQRQGNAQQAGLDKFLFGKAAALVSQDVITMGAVGAIALLLMLLFWKEFKLLSFDPAYGASLGFPMRLIDTLLTSLIVLAIVIGLQTVGVVLMSAMIVAPAAAARQWTDRLDFMVALSALFGVIAGVVGALVSSSGAGLSTGPVIVLVISVIVLISMLLAPNRGLFWEWWRQRRNRQQLRVSAVLTDLHTLATAHGDLYHAHPVGTLRAARPGGGVRRTLRVLSEQGLVRESDKGEWGLTEAGLAEAERLLAAESTTDSPPEAEIATASEPRRDAVLDAK